MLYFANEIVHRIVMSTGNRNSKLAIAMATANINNKQLATKMGLSESAVGAWINYSAQPQLTPEGWKKLAQLLDLTKSKTVALFVSGGGIVKFSAAQILWISNDKEEWLTKIS